MSEKKAPYQLPRKEYKYFVSKTPKPVSSEPKTPCPYTFPPPVRHPCAEKR